MDTPIFQHSLDGTRRARTIRRLPAQFSCAPPKVLNLSFLPWTGISVQGPVLTYLILFTHRHRTSALFADPFDPAAMLQRGIDNGALLDAKSK